MHASVMRGACRRFGHTHAAHIAMQAIVPVLLKVGPCLSGDSQSAVHIEQRYSLVSPILCCISHFISRPHRLVKQFLADPRLPLWQGFIWVQPWILCLGELRYTTW